MQDSTRRTTRTGLQFVLGLAAGLPLIIGASGIPGTAPGVGVVLAVALGITRVMALDAVDALLPSWLRKSGAAGTATLVIDLTRGDEAARRLARYIRDAKDQP